MTNNYKKLSSDIAKISDEIDGIVVGICGEEKKQIVIAVSDKLNSKYFASDILKLIMEKTGGKGGGNKKLATGGCMASTKQIVEIFSKLNI